MTWRVARRMNPAPASHKRHAAIRGKRGQPATHIDRAFWIQAGKECHEPAANGWIRRRIRGAAIKVGQLKLMGVNRYIPLFHELFERPNVIEVPVGENDRGGAGVCAKTLFGSGANTPRHTRDTSVNQQPAPI